MSTNMNNKKQTKKKDHENLKEKGSMKKNKGSAALGKVNAEEEVLTKVQKDLRPEEDFYLETQMEVSSKMKIECKTLEKQMLYIKNNLQRQLESLLSVKRNDKLWEIHQQLLSIRLFRIKEVCEEDLFEEYGRLIQATELLYSKLHNNERAKRFIFLEKQEDLILFFKHLFGKPYTLCNLPHFRKIMQIIWEKNHLPNMKAEKMLENLKVWAHGIQLPMNPASIHLQKLVFENSHKIKKDAILHNNEACYCHIEGADCLGLTPLLIAVQSNFHSAYQNIIKSGCNIFHCPLTLIKNKKKSERSIKKSKTGINTYINISYPAQERLQFNAIEVLIFHKQYQQIVNLLSLEETKKIKDLKKYKKQVYERIAKIPDCCLQLHWKTFNKGFLFFKTLPKDVIVIYKKGGFLRIDYRVDDFEKPTANGNFTILIKTYELEERKMEYYLINHGSKKIYDLMKEVDSSKIKLRYEQMTSYGNIENQQIIGSKAIIKQEINDKMSMEINPQFGYENVLKANLHPFKNLKDYQKCLYDSEILDYARVEFSQVSALLEQKIGTLPKVKSKFIKNTNNIKINWINEKITMQDITDMLEILDRKSVFFVKVFKIFKIITTQPQFLAHHFESKLPQTITMDMGNDFGLNLEIKNLMYCSLDEAVFSLQYRTKEQNYDEINVGLQSLQETMIMNESYSIDISKFLGKTEKLREKEEQDLNKMFEELLTREMQANEEEEEENGRNIIPPSFL